MKNLPFWESVWSGDLDLDRDLDRDLRSYFWQVWWSDLDLDHIFRSDLDLDLDHIFRDLWMLWLKTTTSYSAIYWILAKAHLNPFQNK